jgi:hypothetical protein
MQDPEPNTYIQFRVVRDPKLIPKGLVSLRDTYAETECDRITSAGHAGRVKTVKLLCKDLRGELFVDPVDVAAYIEWRKNRTKGSEDVPPIQADLSLGKLEESIPNGDIPLAGSTKQSEAPAPKWDASLRFGVFSGLTGEQSKRMHTYMEKAANKAFFSIEESADYRELLKLFNAATGAVAPVVCAVKVAPPPEPKVAPDAVVESRRPRNLRVTRLQKVQEEVPQLSWLDSVLRAGRHFIGALLGKAA